MLRIGKAREKARVLRTERRRHPVFGPYPWLVSSTAMVNHYYVHAVEDHFGPFFLKFCSYFPYNAKLCVNGHECLKRRLAKLGVAFEALNNGVPSCADAALMWRLADGPTASRIDALVLRCWRARRSRSAAPTAGPASATTSRSCKPSSPSLGCSTGPSRGRGRRDGVLGRWARGLYRGLSRVGMTESGGARGGAGGSFERIGGLLALLASMYAWGAEESHTVPYLPSAAAEGHAGVVRIESRSGVSGQVLVVAVDDAGRRVEAGRLTLGALAAVEFETAAMESGDPAPGLAGTGPGQGDWRLELTTDLDIEARAYARSEGFLTALHDAALVAGEVELPLFHPGGEARPRSVLRLANAGGERATVTASGVDDAGHPGGEVTVELGAWEARGYTASELESGSAAGLSGSLGDGVGKWRLFLEAERGSAYATNLLLDGSVLSSVPGGMSRGAGGLHRVSLFPSASDGSGRRGVVRVVNRSPESAEVSIDAFDATDRAYERLRLSLGGHCVGAVRLDGPRAGQFGEGSRREARDRARATGGWS